MIKKLLVLGSIAVAAVLSMGAAAVLADSVGPIDFESPAYALGNINGQNGWKALGSAHSGCAVYDEGVSSSLGTSGFGSQSFRISNAITSGCFGDQAFAPAVVNAAGETNASSTTFSAGTLQRHFESQFSIYAIPGSTGDTMSVSPDNGAGARMSYLRFENPGDGYIHVYFDDVTDPTHGTNKDTFNEIAVGKLAVGSPHTIKFSIDLYDGPDNDVVQIYLDGNLVHTGTTWEDYYRYDSESNPGHDTSFTPIVRTMLFRAAGTAVPANAGKGYLIDNLSLSTGAIAAANGCTTVKLVSGPQTETAGWTATTLTGPSMGLDATNFSNVQNPNIGGLIAAALTQAVIPPWVDPTATSTFAGSGAAWISTDPTWPGHAGNSEGSDHDNQWRLFSDGFVIPSGAVVTSADLWYTADNAADVYLGSNTSPISTTGFVYGPADPNNDPYYSQIFHTTLAPTTGYNLLSFVVRNWGGNYDPNPTGLLYKATIIYCTTGTLTVTKQVTNETHPTTFTFVGTGGIGTFTLTASKGNDGSQTFTLPAGTYSVTETVPHGWVENTNSCGNVAVTAGGSVSCTIKNTETQSNTVHIHNSNDATITVTTSASSNTGGNDANGNSNGRGNNSGSGVVNTGNAYSSAGSFNFVNTNITHIHIPHH